MSLAVPALENGLVRVFALSMSPKEARALKDGGAVALAGALGCGPIDPDHVEVFPLADLGDMALADYLIEGAGALPAEIDAQRGRLGALDGWVMVVYSAAFAGAAQDIRPAPALTLIGTFRQEAVDWSAPMDLSTPSALPTPHVTARKRPSDAAMSGRIAMGALVVAFLVVGLMIWVGG